MQNGLDAWIDVLEEEELLEAKQEEVKESVDTPIEGNESEHELYHGEVEKTDKEKLIGMVESKKNKSKKRVVKRPPPIARVKKSYKYRG